MAKVTGITAFLTALVAQRSSAASTKKWGCAIDQSVLNAKDLSKVPDVGFSFFAPLCGRNRGAFVLSPPDGHTYACTAFPAAWSESYPHVTVADSNSLMKNSELQGGNLTAAETLEVLDKFVSAVYTSSAGRESDPGACDTAGLTKLSCGAETDLATASSPFEGIAGPLRSATLAGVFVKAPWATGGAAEPKGEGWYTPQDFAEMAVAGLNAVQLPVPLGFFDTSSSTQDASLLPPVEAVVGSAATAQLGVVLELVPATNEEANDAALVSAAASWAAATPGVIGLVLPEPTLSALGAARQAASNSNPQFPLLVPSAASDSFQLQAAAMVAGTDPWAFVALDFAHNKAAGDVASDSSVDDRLKMFYHESLGCGFKATVEWAGCASRSAGGAYVSGGFDLSVDDCADPGHPDYGQCDRLDEQTGSNWWALHRASLVTRRLSSFERGLGWSFAAWKVEPAAAIVDDGEMRAQEAELVDPAQLRSLRAVTAAGLFPELGSKAVAQVCVAGPAADFVLGDATLAPTPSPPPACDGGWWDPEQGKCAYWVPPPPPPPCPVYNASNPNSAWVSITGCALFLLILLGAYKLGTRSGGAGNGTSRSGNYFSISPERESLL